MFYDENAEVTSRIAVDMMLIACSSHVMELYCTLFSRKKEDFEDREMVKVYPEVDVAVDVMDPKTKDTVTGTLRQRRATSYSPCYRTRRLGLWLQRPTGYCAGCFRLPNPSF